MATTIKALMAPEGTTLIETGYAVGPETPTTRNGRHYMIRTCYEFISGRWEGFVSLREIKSV